jgi:hypothetical protein
MCYQPQRRERLAVKIIKPEFGEACFGFIHQLKKRQYPLNYLFEE